MDKKQGFVKEFVHLATFITSNRLEDASALIRKELPSLIKKFPEFQSEFERISSGLQKGIVRKSQPDPMPIDIDSRMELLKRENRLPLSTDPIVWPHEVHETLLAVINERKNEEKLLAAGVTPTKSMLLVGQPGVGKTLAAKWLAKELNKELLVLDLAAVMSSYLGRTGNNIRAVLEYAKNTNSILLLDELDAIAKKRDDDSEVGELKRLVTVLLQAIDDWPSSGILLAATNHPEILDPAVWRRFERVQIFPLPSSEDILKQIKMICPNVEEQLKIAASISMTGLSFADVERELKNSIKASIIDKTELNDEIENLIARRVNNLSKKDKIEIAAQLSKSGYTQRKISDLTGIARDTVRKHTSQ